MTDSTQALKDEILALKKEKNAVILAHNYQRPEIQDIADFVGDSLGLSYKAREANADVIAFCGVHFMAETAKIVNPDKTVILPDIEAGCSLADSCSWQDLAAFLEENEEEDYYVIAYINCSIGVKALSDVIVTSGNAVQIIEQAPEDRPILFVPDQNLGAWVMEKTGRPMTVWAGACHVHAQFTRESLEALREEYPGAPILAHPECPAAVRMFADEVCSTERMIPYCKECPSETIIIVTESGMIHRLEKEVPGKKFIPVGIGNCSCSECAFMKMNTLEKLRDALLNLEPKIELDTHLLQRAQFPLLRMLEQSK